MRKVVNALDVLDEPAVVDVSNSNFRGEGDGVSVPLQDKPLFLNSADNVVIITEAEKVVGSEEKAATTPIMSKTPFFAERLLPCDLIGKFNERGQIGFGEVAINSETKQTRVFWNDGRLESLEVKEGSVILKHTIGVMDRKTVGYGSKVTDGKGRTGQVREKRFLVSLVLHENGNALVKDVPCENLIRMGYNKKDDKVVYNNEYIGMVVNTRAKVFFSMDKDGRNGYVADDSYGSVFPRVGDKIKMLIYYLWDAKWVEPNAWYWYNFFKYLGDPATITDTEIDCFSIAWMGSIDNGVLSKQGEELPKNALRAPEEVNKVRHLYGRNWKYVREHEIWGFRWTKENSLLTFDQWVKQISDEVFFGLKYNSLDMSPDMEDITLPKIEPGELIQGKVVSWRSIVDVEWDDGSFETLPTFKTFPYYYPSSTDENENIFETHFVAGDIVADLKTENSEKYGYIVKVLEDRVQVVWVTPDPEGHLPKVSMITDVVTTDIDLHSNYYYLKSLHQLPVLVPRLKNQNGERVAVDGIRVAVAVGVNLAEAKVVVKCPDEVERLIWAHDFDHFEGDVIMDFKNAKYIPWYSFDENERKRNRCAVMKSRVKVKAPPFVTLVFQDENESDSDD